MASKVARWASLILSVSAAVLAAPSGQASALESRQRPLPTILYRGDPRSPEELRKIGGMPPEFDGPTTDTSYSLLAHHKGEGKVASAYASTSKSFSIALAYAVGKNYGATPSDGWVYWVHPTPNMIDMDDSDFVKVYGLEEEFSAMGGIRWDQVEAYIKLPQNITDGFLKTYVRGWRTFEGFSRQFPDMKWVKNKDYDPRYDRYAPSPGQPQLAGDDLSLDRYWRNSLEEHAIEFMKRNGGPVEWNGRVPMNVLKPIKEQPASEPLPSASPSPTGIPPVDAPPASTPVAVSPKTPSASPLRPYITRGRLSPSCFVGRLEKCLGTHRYCKGRAWRWPNEPKRYRGSRDCFADRQPAPTGN
ncbi:hypothetical protein HIM_08168 [Hirsutella minnesotensis 3608]|uniref:Enterotoxin n=1 Tax=Hirsutella minnesotensis 3608 TaxID=1043627 RepID=A0A0F8A3V7_9HYPO|nr:hypothetical protein HIM_08168 [Hirsutella minnesotensis 3608]